MSLAQLQRAIYDQEKMGSRFGCSSPSEADSLDLTRDNHHNTIQIDVDTCQRVQNLVSVIRHNFSELLSMKTVLNDPDVCNSVSFLFSRISELESVVMRSNLNVPTPNYASERIGAANNLNYLSSSSVSSPESSPRRNSDFSEMSVKSESDDYERKAHKRKAEDTHQNRYHYDNATTHNNDAKNLFNSECKLKMRRTRAKQAPSVTGQLSCRACGETKTCEWRRGPDGYKSLCNACGIHYAKIVKKEESLSNYVPKTVSLTNILND